MFKKNIYIYTGIISSFTFQGNFNIDINNFIRNFIAMVKRAQGIKF